MKMKKQNKAFTLVELMIVIAIIGVLAATLLPRLQGAQERSRDTGRVTSLKNIAAVMQTYFTDEGAYPSSPQDTGSANTASNANGCLSDSTGTVHADLANLFKGGKAPLDPQKNSISAPCAAAGIFGYASLEKNGIDDGGYALNANVEAYKKANCDFGSGCTFDHPGGGTYTDYNAVILSEVGFLAGEPSGGANDSTYIEKS